MGIVSVLVLLSLQFGGEGKGWRSSGETSGESLERGTADILEAPGSSLQVPDLGVNCNLAKGTLDFWRKEMWNSDSDSGLNVMSIITMKGQFHREENVAVFDDNASISPLQKPILEPPYIESHHRICTYNETRMVTVKLPRCAPDVDPFYTYPVAIRCDCDICSTATTECETY
ncbi:hypothetical protein EK904_008819 [Melospiza melodia maxima]|nr:hypothetical protein EK904_008819 [Melospiza melodia maxima]